MTILAIEHVAITADDTGATIGLLQALGLAPFHQEDLPADGVRSNQFASGSAVVEVLEPIRDDAPVRAFVARRGPGLHHVCFQVDDLESTIAQLQAQGLQLVTPQPREDSQGRRVFLHPRSGQGVLMGFVEHHTS